MAVDKIFAQLCCSDLAVSRAWFRALFGREPDAVPMPGLAEWHHGGSAGLQLFENSRDAGHGTLTLIVSGIREEHSRLAAAGLEPGGIEPATTTTLVQLRDPDGNLVVLAEPLGD